MKNFFLFLVCSFTLFGIAEAQNLNDLASTYEGENGREYMQPLGDCFGAALNSGLNQSAKISHSGFHIRIGLHAMTAFVAEDQKTFMAQTQGDFSPAQTVEAPTVFGSTEGASVAGVAGTGYLFPGGLDVQRLPIAVPQITLGSFKGTEVMFRFIQMDLDDNFKELSLTGYGVRHSISQYFAAFPIDLTASIFLQKFKVGDIVNADALYYGLQASRRFGIITLYGGMGLGSSTTTIEYELDSATDPQIISFDLKSGTALRVNAGLLFQLGPLFIHSDYQLGPQNVLALGCGFAI
jgi:hypothetical protein